MIVGLKHYPAMEDAGIKGLDCIPPKYMKLKFPKIETHNPLIGIPDRTAE